jgi:hypothetical protein
MSPISADVWMRVEQSRPTGDRLAARFGAPDITDRLLCACDSQGQRHLLIPLGEQEEAFNDAQSRGLNVVTRELVVHGSNPARYLDLECRDPSGHPVLDVIGTELAQGISAVDSKPAEVTRRVLARWRRFWGQAPRAILSRNEQIGLFSELWFLDVWLAVAVGVADAIRRWRGPFGSRHDFEWARKSVEVKATMSGRGRIHRVNGVEQLVPPQEGSLLLFSVRLRDEGGATDSLPLLVGKIRERIRSDDELLGEFESALFQAGYSPVHDEEYEKTLLRIVDERLFAVTNDFPRIVPDTFGEGLPPGVESLEYEINLNGFEQLVLASSPDQGALHLN